MYPFIISVDPFYIVLIHLARFNTYCEVVVDGQKHGNLRTDVVKKTVNPTWDEEFTA